FKVKMPTEKFNGVIAGGLNFKEKVTEKTEVSEEDQGMSIQNEYSYVLALLLRQNQEVVRPELKLTAVSAAQVNHRNVINATLQNPQATYLNSLYVTAKVTKKGSDEVLYTASNEGMQ